jgi:hypothetical protein
MLATAMPKIHSLVFCSPVAPRLDVTVYRAGTYPFPSTSKTFLSIHQRAHSRSIDPEAFPHSYLRTMQKLRAKWFSPHAPLSFFAPPVNGEPTYCHHHRKHS